MWLFKYLCTAPLTDSYTITHIQCHCIVHLQQYKWTQTKRRIGLMYSSPRMPMWLIEKTLNVHYGVYIYAMRGLIRRGDMQLYDAYRWHAYETWNRMPAELNDKRAEWGWPNDPPNDSPRSPRSLRSPRSPEIVGKLRRGLKPPSNRQLDPLWFRAACKSGSISLVQWFIEHCPTPVDLQSGLNAAIQRGHVNVVCWLITYIGHPIRPSYYAIARGWATMLPIEHTAWVTQCFDWWGPPSTAEELDHWNHGCKELPHSKLINSFISPSINDGIHVSRNME